MYHWKTVRQIESALLDEYWESLCPPIARLSPDWPPHTDLDFALYTARLAHRNQPNAIKARYGYFNPLNHTL